MHIKVLGSHGSRMPGFNTSSMLIDGEMLLDAGTITSRLPIEEQARIDAVLLTHAHLDHIVDLSFLIDNVFTLRSSPLRVMAPEPVLRSVREHLFNNEIWPDFSKLSMGSFPAMEFVPLKVDAPFQIGPYTVHMRQTNHPVFTVGYCFDQGDGSVFFSGDTGVTDELWAMGYNCPKLKIAFVETSFPNRLRKIAEASGHLTPEMLAGELKKFGRDDVPLKVFHMKPQFLDEIVAELKALNHPCMQILAGGEVFTI